MSQDYNKTLKLPNTEFPMRGNLPQRESEVFSNFQKNKLYEKLIEKNEGKPNYILHDGPPYANGDIHLGTALNKILKDIIVKQKNMTGYKSTYIPGWDTHGLPIELKAIKTLSDKNNISPVELRKKCKEFALHYLSVQRDQFRRLGVIGDFDNPYLTLNPEFEAKQIEIFGKMAQDGYIYKGLKPVHWCAKCNTALAEAEIEYENDSCDSIYVKFQVLNDRGLFKGIDLSKAYFLIWTTTAWTLPANVAICLGGEFEYSLVEVDGEYLVVASELVETTMKMASKIDYKIVSKFSGSDLENITTQHPFLDRKSLVINGDHVTLEAGTGCVHTAPGHGVEDFEVCKKYKHLEVIVPVNERGILTEQAGEFEGMHIKKASKFIIEKLLNSGHLLSTNNITHQYPHCWRCSDPVLFRATEQWFCSIDGFKDNAIKAIESVNWIPKWGEDRIKGMVKDRNDWCVSRQRIWGVPIPIIYCVDCKSPIINDQTIEIISKLFENEGSDSWYIKSAQEIFADKIKCSCGCTKFEKEMDIMDVWFDSGVTHTAVLDNRSDVAFPADLYLEGNDQYRGWFQSSLLTAVAYRGLAPYKNVCTHGWVVDGNGRKMSKSLGNGISPEKIVNEYGADILRLWVASSDYHSDIRISKEILKQLSEGYRKIRNTSRFILGNISDFDPNKDMVNFSNLEEIDRWALYKLNNLIDRVKEAYNNFDFHLVYHSIRNFCVIDMSNFYLDLIKDILYCDGEDSCKRRSSQTSIYIIIDSITKMLAPILPFTSEEIWKYMPHNISDNTDSVYLNDMCENVEIDISREFIDRWEKIYNIREEVQKAMELKRSDKIIGSSLESEVVFHLDIELYSFLCGLDVDLTSIFMVSGVKYKQDQLGEFKSDISGLSITIVKSDFDKCERCWGYKESVGTKISHPKLCSRCFEVID